MYIKVINKKVEKYPYSIDLLRKDNPQTSFPLNPDDELLSEWNVYRVQGTPKPTYTYKQNVDEGTPEFVNGQWTQTWLVTDKPQEEIDAINEQLRATAYRTESDPLFFKYQRGEIDKQVWLDKVEEIKQRYA